jgi:hypothetical protein
MLSLPSVKIHASCRIGSNAISSEGMPSFAEANLSPSLDQDQGKHLAFPFNSFFLLWNTLCYIHDCALTCRSLLKP